MQIVQISIVLKIVSLAIEAYDLHYYDNNGERIRSFDFLVTVLDIFVHYFIFLLIFLLAKGWKTTNRLAPELGIIFPTIMAVAMMEAIVVFMNKYIFRDDFNLHDHTNFSIFCICAMRLFTAINFSYFLVELYPRIKNFTLMKIFLSYFSFFSLVFIASSPGILVYAKFLVASYYQYKFIINSTLGVELACLVGLTVGLGSEKSIFYRILCEREKGLGYVFFKSE